jgi:hypothetical protein
MGFAVSMDFRRNVSAALEQVFALCGGKAHQAPPCAEWTRGSALDRRNSSIPPRKAAA